MTYFCFWKKIFPFTIGYVYLIFLPFGVVIRFVDSGVFGEGILYIIIDGYNVIGILHNDLEKARGDFIDLLIKYKTAKNHYIAVVFDAYKSGDKSEQISFSGGLKIIYTRLGETADDVIKRIISEERREWIVVTSDRDVIKHTWSVNSIPVPSDIFLDILQRGSYCLENSLEDVEDIEDNKPQKGSPYRLSKKDRAVRKALSKI